MNEVLLRATDVTRRFGGLVAVDSVSLELQRGAVHAVIGTNGAGKSTLINILSGELAASGGRVELRGTDITGWPQARRARAGVGRSYQRTTIYPTFTRARELPPRGAGAPPAALGLVGRCSGLHRQRAGGARRRGTCRPGARAATSAAGTLSHGQRRQLEIAMCLATAPEVLLLDEPLAGMGAEETERMLALLAELKAGHAIALVEHDMDAVFRIADRITVMVNGAVLASDTPEAVRRNPDVQAAYLGGHE